MSKNYLSMERSIVRIDASETGRPLEVRRQGIGIGGVSSEPLPERVAEAIGRLKPRLVRVFLQEYFDVYPDHGVFDWSRLDPYMDRIAEMGCKVLATVNLKPPVLFPEPGHDHWMPNNPEEYQEVIRALVRRYSLEKPIVTHWEHANETDIGETGGCPFLMTTAEDNHFFYKMLMEPVLEVFPQARVGGPAIANWKSPILKGFIDLCRENGTPLHFVSWHSYCSDCEDFIRQVTAVRELVEIYPVDGRPELMINEMNKGFDFQDMNHPDFHLVSVEEQAHQPLRAAFLAANLMGLIDAGLDWSHYYHAWDCGMHPAEFARFFSPTGVREVMYRHWNEFPLRYGLFSDDSRVRPQYFVYRLLQQMEGNRTGCVVESDDLHALASRREGQVAVLLSHYGKGADTDRLAILRFSELVPGRKRLTVFRIDEERRWDENTLELIPVESRRIDTLQEYHCQCYCPVNSVVAVFLED